MAQSLIDILIRARNQASGPINEVNTGLKALDNFAGVAAKGLAGLAGAAAIGGLVELAGALTDLARRGAVFEQLGSVLDDFAASVNSSSEAMINAAKKAAQGTISEYELILNANRAIQFEVAKTPEQFAKLVELSTALGRAQGISDTQALEYITTGLARESRLILDNLGLIIDLDSATANYAATIGKQADQLTQAERKQALLNEAYKQGATALQANRDASDSAATNFERMDASIQNAKDALGALFAPAVAQVAQSIATAAEAAAGQVERLGQAASEGDARGLANIIAKLREGEAILRGNLAAAREGGDFAEIVAASQDLERQQNLLTEATRQYFAALRLAYPAIEDNAAAMAELRNQTAQNSYAQRANADAASQAKANYDPLNIATNSLATETAGLNTALTGTPGWIRQVANAAIAAGVPIAQVTLEIQRLKGELGDLESAGAGARNAIINQAAGVAGIVGDARATQLAKEQIGKLNFGVAALRQQLKDGTITSTEFDYQLARLDDTTTSVFGSIREADAEAKRFASQGLSMASDAANQAEQAFNDLKGKVSGVLSGALDPGVGVNPDDILANLGVRQDGVSEAARRLADVAVKGFDSPWFEYMRTAFPALFQEYFAGATSPEGVKIQAANLLKNFQDGLVPQLIDADRAKELVRRMIIGDQRMEELAAQIAGELSAELGNVSVADAEGLARRALGVGGAGGLLQPPDSGEVANQYGGIGATAAAAFTGGVQGAIVDGDLGTQVITALDEQLRAESNLAILSEGGKISGRAWGNSFLSVVSEGVPSRLVEILASLVTPSVENLLNQRATLQGAR